MPERGLDNKLTLRSGDTRSETSPDGRFRIDYLLTEGRHSLWIETPTVHDLKTGSKVFSFHSSDWDAEVDWLGDGSFTLFIRRYPDAYTLPVHFEVDKAKFAIGDEPRRYPIAKARQSIEKHFNNRKKEKPLIGSQEINHPVPAGVRWLQ